MFFIPFVINMDLSILAIGGKRRLPEWKGGCWQCSDARRTCCAVFVCVCTCVCKFFDSVWVTKLMHANGASCTFLFAVVWQHVSPCCSFYVVFLVLCAGLRASRLVMSWHPLHHSSRSAAVTLQQQFTHYYFIITCIIFLLFTIYSWFITYVLCCCRRRGEFTIATTGVNSNNLKLTSKEKLRPGNM